MSDKDIVINDIDAGKSFQCIWYLNHKITAPKFSEMLKANGDFLILYMGWLPFEDEIAGKSERLISKNNPQWTGCGDTVHPVWVPEEYLEYFKIEKQEEFRVDIPFTRDTGMEECELI